MPAQHSEQQAARENLEDALNDLRDALLGIQDAEADLRRHRAARDKALIHLSAHGIHAYTLEE